MISVLLQCQNQLTQNVLIFTVEELIALKKKKQEAERKRKLETMKEVAEKEAELPPQEQPQTNVQ
jgi:hypothetical protein